MTMRQQITELMQQGLRDCQIKQRLGCTSSSIFRARVKAKIKADRACEQRIRPVFNGCIRGLNDKQIAAELGVSENTIKRTRHFAGITRIKLHEHHFEIVALRAAGEKHALLSARFGVSEYGIVKILAKQRLLDK